MRIDELIKPKELDDYRNDLDSISFDNSRSNLRKYMKKYGFTPLGDGAYAEVFSHKKYPNEVFKIFYDDPDTIKWYKYCIKNKNNPFLPKIKSKPIMIQEFLSIVRMEKLSFKDNTTQANISGFLKGFSKSIIYFYEDFNDAAVALNKTIDFMNEDDKTIRDFSSLYNNKYFQNAIMSALKIREFYSLDLHKENFMWRGDQLVLTDPVASGD